MMGIAKYDEIMVTTMLMRVYQPASAYLLKTLNRMDEENYDDKL